MFTITHAGATDVGLRRKNNEDALLIMPDIQLYAVADGMGGAAAGEVASSIFVETVRELFPNEGLLSEEYFSAALQDIFRVANMRILEYGFLNPEAHGLGCTADILTFCEDKYFIGHVGDSRIYLLRDGVLKQITKDHSLVQLQVDNGVLSVNDARNHPKKNIILRALGIDKELSLDLMRGRALDNDIFLLCTDGLSDLLDENYICSIISADEPLTVAVEALISAAKAAGGKDNITALLCKVSIE